jgi:hypothetical protein
MKIFTFPVIFNNSDFFYLYRFQHHPLQDAAISIRYAVQDDYLTL